MIYKEVCLKNRFFYESIIFYQLAKLYSCYFSNVLRNVIHSGTVHRNDEHSLALTFTKYVFVLMDKKNVLVL